MNDQGWIGRKFSPISLLRKAHTVPRQFSILPSFCAVAMRSVAVVWPDFRTCFPLSSQFDVRSSAGGQESVRRSCRGVDQLHGAWALLAGDAS